MKSYTDLEQSKKLSEILPLESVDMWYHGHYSPWESERKYDEEPCHFHSMRANWDKPCWSLAALLDILPKEINALGTTYSINIHTKNEKWFIDYKCNNEEFVGAYSNTFLDACYEMIIKLNELKML